MFPTKLTQRDPTTRGEYLLRTKDIQDIRNDWKRNRVMTHVWRNDTEITKINLAANCHLSLHACNRSLFVRGLSIDSRACVIALANQSAAPHLRQSGRLSGQRRILFTQPRGTPEHEHRLWVSFSKLYFPWYIFPPHLSAFAHRAILIWGDWDMAGGCSKNKPLLTAPSFVTHCA